MNKEQYLLTHEKIFILLDLLNSLKHVLSNMFFSNTNETIKINFINNQLDSYCLLLKDYLEIEESNLNDNKLYNSHFILLEEYLIKITKII
jgi:hypothetical protein